MEKEKRLEAFEKMLEAIEREYETTVERMEKLKKQGKVKSVTYQQMMVRKLMYINMLDLYHIYGIREKN